MNSLPANLNKPQNNFIHPNAKVHPTAQIGNFSSIYGDVEIGEGTVIGPNVTI